MKDREKMTDYLSQVDDKYLTDTIQHTNIKNSGYVSKARTGSFNWRLFATVAACAVVGIGTWLSLLVGMNYAGKNNGSNDSPAGIAAGESTSVQDPDTEQTTQETATDAQTAGTEQTTQDELYNQDNIIITKYGKDGADIKTLYACSPLTDKVIAEIESLETDTNLMIEDYYHLPAEGADDGDVWIVETKRTGRYIFTDDMTGAAQVLGGDLTPGGTVSGTKKIMTETLAECIRQAWKIASKQEARLLAAIEVDGKYDEEMLRNNPSGLEIEAHLMDETDILITDSYFPYREPESIVPYVNDAQLQKIKVKLLKRIKFYAENTSLIYVNYYDYDTRELVYTDYNVSDYISGDTLDLPMNQLPNEGRYIVCFYMVTETPDPETYVNKVSSYQAVFAVDIAGMKEAAETAAPQPEAETD